MYIHTCIHTYILTYLHTHTLYINYILARRRPEARQTGRQTDRYDIHIHIHLYIYTYIYIYREREILEFTFYI